MLINREWKHSFESYPSNSITSLVSVWDLMFDENGNSWFESYSKNSIDENGEELDSNMGCNLEHDIICYNKNLYKSEVTNSAEYNIQDSKIPENGIEVKFDSEFEKNTNKYLFGTFGIDISIPFYAAASRPEKLEIPNTADFGTFKNKQFYKYDKNGVIPYGDLRTFTINSISSNNSWGNKPSITANDGFVEPIYFTTFFPPKVGPYDEEKSVTELRDIGYDIWLKGKNTQFASDNNLDEKFEPYNSICIDPKSNFGKMLIIRTVSLKSDTFPSRGNQPASNKESYASLIGNNSEFFKLAEIKDLLQNTFVWVRAPFFADYVKPNSYNQNLNKGSKVVHKDLILSENGDFNEFNESIFAQYTIEDDENSETILDKNTNWIDTLPYISKTAPVLDFIKPKDFDISKYIGSDNWFKDYDITGIPIPTTMFKLGFDGENDNFTTDNLKNMFCPFIYWNTEYAETVGSADAFKSFTNGVSPVFLKKFGNLYADGRIFSPTIDEIWTAYKELVCGRTDTNSDKDKDDGAIPIAADTILKLSSNHRITYSNAKNKWSFKFEELERQGDPLNFELGYYDSEGNIIPTKVTDYINHNDSISYNIFSSIKNLNNTLRTSLKGNSITERNSVDYAARISYFNLGKPYNELPANFTNASEYSENNIKYGTAPAGKYPTDRTATAFKNFIFGPRPNPYSLRELEAMSKGNRYNIDTLAIWLKKNVVINSKVTYRYNSSATDTTYSNEAKSGLYQFHKDYNGEFSDNTQFVQNKDSGGFLQFDDNSKFATRYTLRKNFARKRINMQQNKVDSSQVYLAADGTWRYIFEKSRAQIVQTSR